ncbi:hypothetical protein F4604DRAFT_1940711 [Suillus subluteus]|nr:hypothetical protein F4604DRAFT_1940711 [Suillus subluteus]
MHLVQHIRSYVRLNWLLGPSHARLASIWISIRSLLALVCLLSSLQNSYHLDAAFALLQSIQRSHWMYTENTFHATLLNVKFSPIYLHCMGALASVLPFALPFLSDDDNNGGGYARSEQWRAEQRARELEAQADTARQEAEEARRRADEAESRSRTAQEEATLSQE